MKKILFLPIAAFIFHGTIAQVKMQATIKPGPAPNTISIFAKPSTSFAQKDEGLTISLAFPADIKSAPVLGTSGVLNNKARRHTGSGLMPVIKENSIATTSYELVVTQDEILSQPYYVFTFLFAGTAASTRLWLSGKEQHLVTLGFDGCTSGCDISLVKMISLPSGGSSQSSYWYFQSNTIGDITNYSNPFYENEYTGKVVNGGSTNGAAYSAIELNRTGTGLAGTVDNNLVQVFPSLTSGMVNVHLPLGIEKATIRIVNSAGKIVLGDDSKKANRSINLSKLSSGTYLVQVIVHKKNVHSSSIVLQP